MGEINNTLTQKQLDFISEYFKNGRRIIEAYRVAYQTDKGAPSWAYHFFDRDDVKYELHRLEQQVRKNSLISLEKVVENLKRIEQQAFDDKKYKEAIEANVQMAKLTGISEEQPKKIEYGGEVTSKQITIQLVGLTPPKQIPENTPQEIEETEFEDLSNE
jgi:hypothetical protein